MTNSSSPASCFRRGLRSVGLVAFIFGIPWPGWSQESTLVPLQGPPVSARLAGISDDGVRFLVEDSESGSKERIFKPHELVRWGHVMHARATEQVYLSDGSLLIGRLTKLTREAVVLETDVWGELTIPRSLTAGVVWNSIPDVNLSWQFRQRVQDANSSSGEPILLLKNGDELSGEVVSGDDRQVQFLADEGPLDVRLDRVNAWLCGSRSGNTPSAGVAQRIVVGFRDGSMLTTSRLNIEGNVQASLTCGLTLLTVPGVRAVDEDLVCYLRFDGRHVRYLSDATSIGYKHIPYLTTTWSWGRDRNTLQGPLSSTLPSVLFAKGIGMHSTSRLAFAWQDERAEFQAELAVDGSSGHRGSVVFRVFLFGETGWQQAYQSPVVRGGEQPLPVRLSLPSQAFRSKQRLALVVDYADKGDVLDRANWIGARLVQKNGSE